MTGRYPHVNGLMGLVGLGWELPRSERTLPQYLKDVDYHPVLCGIQHERSEATSLGYSRALDTGRSRQAPELAEAAADFLAHEPPEPFFLSLGTVEPHRPFRVEELDGDLAADGPPYLPDNTIVRRQMAGFARLVARLDEAAGRILRALDDAGLSENTLVIFTTDHGIDMPRAKGTLYDPGIETALLMRWPGRIPAGSSFDELLSNVDLLPTVLEALGCAVPAGIQGRSFWPLLQGKSYQPREEVFAEKTHHVAYDPMRCIRTATHKYIHNFGPLRHIEIPADVDMDCLAAVPDLVRERRPIYELYDLTSDPLEQTDLAGDAGHAPIEAELQGRLRRWMEETRDPLLEGVMPVPRVL